MIIVLGKLDFRFSINQDFPVPGSPVTTNREVFDKASLTCFKRSSVLINSFSSIRNVSGTAPCPSSIFALLVKSRHDICFTSVFATLRTIPKTASRVLP